MNIKILKSEILIQCQNVQCGAKLAAEIHYIYKDTKFAPEDILFFEETIGHFPELKYLIYFAFDDQAKKDGWKSVYVFKYKEVQSLINAIEDIKQSNPLLYHFASGKLFGYNDYEVMKFIEKENL